MELTLDIFKNDAFSVTSLHRMANNRTYTPQALGAMGIFEPEPIMTREVLLYEEDNAITLVPTTEVGSPDIQQLRDQGRLYAIKTRALRQMDSVRAGELIGIANMALPENIRLQNAQALIDKRTTKMKNRLELTKEYHRLGALQGQVLDANGSTVLADFFDVFGITPPTLVDIDFNNLAEEELLQFLQDTFVRPIEKALKDRMSPAVQIHALVGDNFWGKLMSHPGFRNTYILMMQGGAIAQAMPQLTQTNHWRSVLFAGIMWHNYRGTDDGSTIAIPTNEARFFPMGAMDVFKVFYSPGETMEQAVAPGEPQYMFLRPDERAHPEFVDMFLRSYPLYACLFPKALMKARIKP